MTYTVETFLGKIKPYVIADMGASGILASLTAAQALIESKKGNSGLTEKANNLFGIKGKYNGQSVKMLTTEFVNHKYIKIYADFRKYPSWAESIADHSAMFCHMSRYKNLIGEIDWKRATENVKKDGYATAPDYTLTLQNTIKTYKLYEWDNEVLNARKADKGGSNPYLEPIIAIKLNSRGEGVKWLQWALNHHGYNIAVDGVAGNMTIGAVLDFQKKNGLTVDGVAGEKTRKALKTSWQKSEKA